MKTLTRLQSSSQFTNAFICDLVLTEAVECQRRTEQEESENCEEGVRGEMKMVDKRGWEGVDEANLLASVYHMARLSLIFSTGLGMTLTHCAR